MIVCNCHGVPFPDCPNLHTTDEDREVDSLRERAEGLEAALAYIRATLGPYSEDLTPRDRQKLVENAYLRAVAALRGEG